MAKFLAMGLGQNSLTQNSNLHIWNRHTDIYLSYSIEECLAANDYFTD